MSLFSHCSAPMSTQLFLCPQSPARIILHAHKEKPPAGVEDACGYQRSVIEDVGESSTENDSLFFFNHFS